MQVERDAQTLGFTRVKNLPAPPRFRRPEDRYRGDGLSIGLQDLTPDDRAAVEGLYRFIAHVYEASEGALDTDGPEVLRRLEEHLDAKHLDRAGTAAQQMGRTLVEADQSVALRRAIHDLRGGSLQALLMLLDLVEDGLGLPPDAQRVYLLARDQLKMMRNILPEIDPSRQALDEAEKGHSIELLREKWHDTRYAVPGNETQVVFETQFEGDIAQCCMEFSALDRMVYNLVNNATLHGDGDTVWVQIAPSDTDPRELRVCVANAVSSQQASALSSKASEHAHGLGSLFEGGFTTGGHGLGMRIVAEFVVQGHGLRDVDQAVAEHYVGASVEGGLFSAWFHWPAA